jgi:hypothetical protein
VDQCHLQIKAALLGNFKFPKDRVLVSAVYSFSHDLGDKELQHSVTLEMQHCANTGTPNNLCVARAIDMSCNFEIFAGGDFTSSDRFGSINLLHFSCFCEMDMFSECSYISPFNHLYCAKIYYTGISHLQFDFEFFIIQDLNAQEKVCDEIVVDNFKCIPVWLISKGY